MLKSKGPVSFYDSGAYIMERRLQLHRDLVDILVGLGGMERDVYFQPPTNIKLNYPCIIYKRSSARPVHADNLLYLNKKGYMVTVIDRDPDSPIPDKLAQLPRTRFDRHYTADQLNHDVYTTFY